MISHNAKSILTYFPSSVWSSTIRDERRSGVNYGFLALPTPGLPPAPHLSALWYALLTSSMKRHFPSQFNWRDHRQEYPMRMIQCPWVLQHAYITATHSHFTFKLFLDLQVAKQFGAVLLSWSAYHPMLFSVIDVLYCHVLCGRQNTCRRNALSLAFNNTLRNLDR